MFGTDVFFPQGIFHPNLVKFKNDEIVYVPFTKAIKNDKPINRELLATLRRLSI